MLQASFFIKKETLTQVFSGEFFEVSKNTFSYRPPPVATSGVSQNYFLLVVGSSVIFRIRCLKKLKLINQIYFYLSSLQFLYTPRSSRSQMFFKVGVLKNFAFFRPAFLLKKRLQHKCFPVNVAQFLRIHFYRTPLLAASVLRFRSIFVSTYKKPSQIIQLIE